MEGTMIDLLIYDSDTDEQQRLGRQARNMVALLSDDSINCECRQTVSQMDLYLESDEPYDLSMLEVSDDEDIELTKRVREGREQSDMMLVADNHISPMRYMTPEIRACSLLLRPYDESTMKSTVQDFMAAFFRKRTVPDSDNSILIENRDGRTVIPYSHIYYIEVCEKRLLFRLRDKKYVKYGTLGEIKKELPANFVQCHRSYIFNAGYLDRIKLSENTVFLQNDITVPLSRSYKSSVKEFLNGL